MDGPDWKCWPIGKWIDCMSIAAIVLGVIGGGLLAWSSPYGCPGSFCTLVVGICALVNRCAGINNACFYKVLWIIMLIVALISILCTLFALIWIAAWWSDCYDWPPCRTRAIFSIIWLLLFGIPFVIFELIYAYILFRAEKIQQGCEGQQFP
ncbi:hypothetical protein AAVH_03312 [Aphelenchoides avenae]|nr:hypothetical protein AAVH_03311 [Aphelenchus avenae]KAH7728939.1 hypothetical protein AAVH_03312 [Aphelenchus avenae]